MKTRIARGRSIGDMLALPALASVGAAVAVVAALMAWRDGAPHLLSSLLISAGAGLAAALLGLVVAGRLQRRIAGPIASVTAAMRAVGESHDDGRPVESAADGEVGELLEAFNAMRGVIGERDAAMARRLAALEAAVAEHAVDLRLARDAAEAAICANRDLLATLSHEVRTPVSGLRAMAEVLAAGGLSPGHRRMAEVIARSGATLLAIIDAVIDSANAEIGLEAAAADPAEAVEDVIALFWDHARGKGLDLAAYIDPATPAIVETDPARLRQAIGALVNHAVTFTETGAVMVVAAPRGNGLRIAVRDTGAGIPRHKLAGLFAASGQSDPSAARRFGGAGLGLATCKRLAEAMGGALTAASEPGKGSLFTLDLPMKALAPAPAWPRLAGERAVLAVSGPSTRWALQRYLQAADVAVATAGGDPGLVIADAASLKTAPRGAAPVICLGECGETAAQQLANAGLADLVLAQPLRRRALAAALAQLAAGAPLREALAADVRPEAEALPHFAGRRVLVAGDSAVGREVARLGLASLGCSVTLMGDGPGAVDAALAEPFDLVLMAAAAARLDGFAVAAEIRAREAVAVKLRTPIVGLAAQAAGAAAERWREAGVDAILVRPFTLAALAAALGQFMTPTAAAALVSPASGSPAPRPPRPATATVGPSAAADLLDPQVTGELARLAANGKGDFVARVRRLYRENAPMAVKAVIEACNAHDCEAAARAAHALKSMSLNMGARLVAETAARLEAQARDLGVVNVDQAQVLHRQLLATLDVLEGYPPDLRPTAAADAAPDEEALLADLAEAISNDQLTLVYQPQFDREGETITGIETLVRWTHPTRGFVSPAFFIPIAERYGLIGRVTQWVLNRAMKETADLGDFTISFNASAMEFADPSFVDELAVTIARCGFDPRRLEIEVTETAVLAEEDDVRRNMARLHDLGLKIALDDFGVGYSSLSHLRLFPFDKLKIDRAFVTGCAENVQSATLVHAVVSIGRALGMKVVAEGVETEAQRKFLKVAGVHAMQGYLFAKPEPVAALKARLAAMKAPPSPAWGEAADAEDRQGEPRRRANAS